MLRTVRPLHDGHIAIPDEFQRELGIGEASVVQLTVIDGELRIRPVELGSGSVGSGWLKEAYDLFAPVRDDIREAGYTEAEINAAIDEAIAEVRSRRG